ncbi:MAG: hypothetical protein ABI818_19210, partial [Acidobacteriota bacterium]
PRADRYKAKNFIDTFVYRTGDQIGAWGYTLLLTLGFSMTGMSAVGVGLAIVAIGVAVWLGRRQQLLERTSPFARANGPFAPPL